MARRSRIGRLCVRLLMITVVAELLRGAHIARGLDLAVVILCVIVLFPLLLILLYRWFTRRVLWKVRNRLIVTYLLMGLSPVVLFGTLSGIAAYLLAGQYATNAALSALDQASITLKDEAASEATFTLSEQALPGSSKAQHSAALTDSHISLAVLDGKSWRTLTTPAPTSTPGETTEFEPLPNQPPPSLNLPFRGIVALKGQLYLCSEASVPVGSRSVLVLGSMPLDRRELGEMAKGLGTITLVEGFSGFDDNDVDVDVGGTSTDSSDEPSVKIKNKKKHADKNFATIKGGNLPPRAHFFDVPIVFSAPLTVYSWETGKTDQSPIVVTSRFTLLYAHLFASSANAGTVVRIVLVSIMVFFGGIELFALLMAIGLSRTITRSVADLSRGTREIDAGHLEHRIRVARHDQLGALASSFNGMAASVSNLLLQQREKERLLNELAIAQEVQTTLFPHSPAVLAGLEMHALSLPARTVGGDYFDFIFGGGSGGSGSHLSLALGDISGKGISAALLMASLHSAVRAFSLGQDTAETTAPSPALLLKLLNRHLYLSTQSARYATLFLAFYDVKTRRLTYTNGGHLPPVILSTNGAMRRLDRGGSVVGLLEEMDYVEETVQMESGDILVAFTDGLTEPENEFGEFGEARLLDCVQQNRQLPLPLLAATALKAVQAWIGAGEQPDDMTILLARQL
jgi:phosphoserine phosphatase RsbU/P